MEMKNNKITIRLSDETLKKCNEGMDITNCKVRNEFIEKAIEFYSGYVSAEVHSEFLSDVITDSMKGIIKALENRFGRLLFKIAVEMAKFEQMLASINEMDDETIERLHKRCVDEVKKINGIIKMEDAVKYQRRDDR